MAIGREPGCALGAAGSYFLQLAVHVCGAARQGVDGTLTSLRLFMPSRFWFDAANFLVPH